ncbi:MAG: HypC/HybG/HupF family hydrogenase formation chaperone [Methanomicrobiaceae archaeon]|nr:HypC/HybG/HupF family hydrogenase formation chaperone [Methanomicrobiaceae archaeon]
MYIAVPAEVLEIKDGTIGVADYGDLRQEVRLDLADVWVGEFVLVRVGFAIQKLSSEEALQTCEIVREVYVDIGGMPMIHPGQVIFQIIASI